MMHVIDEERQSCTPVDCSKTCTVFLSRWQRRFVVFFSSRGFSSYCSMLDVLVLTTSYAAYRQQNMYNRNSMQMYVASE